MGQPQPGLTALVTGGGGFLGRRILELLLERGGVAVRSFARGEYPELTAMGVEVVRGDLRKADDVGAAVQGCDVVFHAAAKPPPWGSPTDYQAINVQGTRNVVDACLAAGVPHLVYTSTPSVVAGAGDIRGGDESLPYGSDFAGAWYPRTKAEAEKLVLAANCESLGTVAIRPHQIWGPRDPHFLPRFVQKATSGALRRIGPGNPEVDTTFVDDAATAHLLAWDRLREGAPVAGKAYFISNGERIGLWTMVDRMLEVAGVEPVTRTIPVGLARFAASMGELAWRSFRLSGEPRVTRFVVHQVTHDRWFDIGAARRELGYEPQVGIDEGLNRLRQWWHADRGGGEPRDEDEATHAPT